jgi:hypothetical protein
MKLDFFNPRSASWEPILETFQIVVSSEAIGDGVGRTFKLRVESSSIEELKELKVNISSQLIVTLLAIVSTFRQEGSSGDL